MGLYGYVLLLRYNGSVGQYGKFFCRIYWARSTGSVMRGRRRLEVRSVVRSGFRGLGLLLRRRLYRFISVPSNFAKRARDKRLHLVCLVGSTIRDFLILGGTEVAKGCIESCRKRFRNSMRGTS